MVCSELRWYLVRPHLASFAAAFAVGAMLGRSRLTFVLLSVTVTCSVAQHVPPVGELEARARRGARGSTEKRGAQVWGRRGLRDT